MSEIVSVHDSDFGYKTVVVDTTAFLAGLFARHMEDITNVSFLPYPDDKAPNNAIIYPQNFEQETIEVTYPPEEEGGKEEVTTVNVAENYFEDMQMAWNFAYAVYDNMLSHAVPEHIARQVLPPTMLQARISFMIHPTLMYVDSGDIAEYQDLVTKILTAMDSAE